jgi:sugar transferase EpsL
MQPWRPEGAEGLESVHAAPQLRQLSESTTGPPVPVAPASRVRLGETRARGCARDLLVRALDVLIACASLVLAGPVLLVCSVVRPVSTGGPLLFRQRRAGFQGRTFILFKVRTMSDARDATGTFLPDARRITRFGAFLRRTSLDELPQLWNVIRGDMSVVGPRPLLPEYLERYTTEQARRHDVKPGITGWAQVNGRNAISWEEKFALDVWYVDNRSFWLDVKILALTIVCVFQRSGIDARRDLPMPEFTGTKRCAS